MRLDREEGQSLIIVLVFVVAFALMLTAALGFATSSISANRVMTAIGRQVEAAEAGVEFGIQKVKVGLGAAFGAAPTAEPLPFPVNAESVNVAAAQIDVRSIAISGPATLDIGAVSDYQVLLGGPAFSVSKAAAGTPLASGTYTVRVTAFNAAGESPGSFEQQIALAAGDRLDVAITNRPADTQYAIYVALDAAAPTRQALVSKASGAMTTYEQSMALASGPALPAPVAIPFGATWSVTPTGGAVDQGGRFGASLLGCYTLQAQIGNVSATKKVAVGGATCP